MEITILIKLGELTLKGRNIGTFESRLKTDIRKRLKADCKVITRNGRFFLLVDERHLGTAVSVLSCVPGLTGFAVARTCEKTPEALFAQTVLAARESLGDRKTGTFKVEARRADKSFPLDSRGIATEAGGRILDEVPGLKVDVHRPDFTINVEIRERAYVYSAEYKGERGLPTGTLGRGLLLLSGGIDSPVAGYLMAKRGLILEAAYFHAYPYTSEEARLKVVELARKIAKYAGPVKLHTIPFTETQMLIKRTQAPDATTLMLRAAMMKASDLIAHDIHANCLVTGESLGQVASQTCENLRFTDSIPALPVFRPLIGIDKQDTVSIARKIDTYETSILPYEDCCVIFSPEHPVIKADFEASRRSFEAVLAEGEIEKAIAARTVEYIEYDHSTRI